VLLMRGRPGEARRYFSRSQASCESLEYREGLWRVLQQDAWAQALLGDIDLAIDGQRKALEMANEEGADARELAKGHRYLADTYRMARELDTSQEEYEKALAELRRGVDPRYEDEEWLISAPVVHGIGSLYLDRGDYANAEAELKKSYWMHLNAGDKLRQGFDLNQLGRVETATSGFDVAEDYLRRAELIFTKEAPNQYYALAVQVNFADLFRQRGSERREEAIKHARQAIELSKEGGFTTHSARASLVLALVELDRVDESSWTVKGAVDLLDEAIRQANQLHKGRRDEIADQLTKEVRKFAFTRPRDIALELCSGLRSRWQSQPGGVGGSSGSVDYVPGGLWRAIAELETELVTARRPSAAAGQADS